MAERAIDEKLKYRINPNSRADLAMFTRHLSGVGERYKHPVHGELEIVKHRPIPGHSAPFIEVQLSNDQVSFWTGACYLGTMEFLT